MNESPDPPPRTDPLAAYPARLRHSTEHAQREYGRAADLYARTTGSDGRPTAALPERSLLTDDGQRLAVYRCAPGTAPPGAQAVYVEPASGQWMVPSGRVFVRFAATVNADSQRPQLLQAGYRVSAVPSYAPQAAWLEAADGQPAHALSGIARLEAVAGVENVEPQWLEARQAR